MVNTYNDLPMIAQETSVLDGFALLNDIQMSAISQREEDGFAKVPLIVTAHVQD